MEALAAAAILATAVLSLTQLLIAGSNATSEAGRTTRAALLAAEKIEELRASRPEVSSLTGADAPAPGFSREWTVSPLPADPAFLTLAEVVVRTPGRTTRMVAVVPRASP